MIPFLGLQCLISLGFTYIFLLEAANLSTETINVLEELFNSTRGPTSWRWKNVSEYGNLWNFSVDSVNPCTDSWQGVGCNCTLNDCQLVSLILDGYNMTGTIPSSIGSLTSLTKLSLSRGKLFGSIPHSIGKLSKLNELKLFGQFFHGTIPSSIGNLTLLQYLELDSNKLKGNIPEEVFNCVNLHTLTMSFNLISGTISESIGNLQSLRIFSLDNNSIESPFPTNIRYLQNLSSLSLSSNLLSGSFPSVIYELTSLTNLNLGDNKFSGSFPVNLHLLTNLERLILSKNDIAGALSESLFNCTSLLVLNLYDNYLSGTFPDSFPKLFNLKALNLGLNNFYGTLPESLFTMVQLEQISILGNYFSGNLTRYDYTNFRNLTILNLAGNNFTGPLPVEFANISSLICLFLDENYLTGTIPPEYGNFTSLKRLSISRNLLTGTIPEFLREDNPILTIYLYTNSLVGTIPASFSRLKYLSLLLLDSNSLEGNITTIFQSLDTLLELNVKDNQFTGPIDNGKWPILTNFVVFNNYFTGRMDHLLNSSFLLWYVDMGSNLFTGPVPSIIGDPSYIILSYLYINDNFLTGTIPFHQMTKKSRLLQLWIQDNLITGTLPPQLSLSSKLNQLFIQYNRISGTYPQIYSQLADLSQLFIESNLLTGPVSNLFNASNQVLLSDVDISANQFTGQLPSDFYMLQKVQSFAASTNCLSGSISEKFCDMKSLQSLALDGINSAENCRIQLFPRIKYLNAFILQENIAGSIPSCLLQMKSLRSLHISGNGLTGTLPNVPWISNSLTEFVATNNRLVGTIPSNIQERSWTILALMYNNLNGALLDSFHSLAPNASLSLHVNHLSGPIPKSLLTANNISILEGNMFSCALFSGATDLPQNDPYVNIYSCGSNETNEAFIFWAIFLILPITLLVMYMKMRSDSDEVKSMSQHQEELREESKAEATFSSSMRASSSLYNKLSYIFRELTLWKDELYAEQYSNSVVYLANFLRIIRQLFVQITLFIVVIVLPIYIGTSRAYPLYSYEYIWLLSGLLNTGLVPGIILMVCFTAINLFVFYALALIPAKLQHRERESLQSDTGEHSRISVLSTFSWFRYDVLIKGVVCCVNFAAMLIIDALYVYIYLNSTTRIIIITQIANALFKLFWNEALLWRFLPAARYFISRYNSDSAALSQPWMFYRKTKGFVLSMVLFNNTLIPMFAIMVVSPDCLYNAFFAGDSIPASYSFKLCVEIIYASLSPLCMQYIDVVHTTQFTPPFSYSYQCSSFLIINYASVYVFMFGIIGIVVPVFRLLIKFWVNSRGEGAAKFIVGLLPIPLRPLKQSDQDIAHSPVVEVNRLVVRLNAYLAILLSYGALFPPLAAIIAITVCSMCYFEEISIGRLLFLARKNSIAWYQQRIEVECDGMGESFVYTVYFITPIASLVFAYIVYDTIAGAGYWSLAVALAVILAVQPFLFKAVLFKNLNFASRTATVRQHSKRYATGFRPDDSSVEHVINPLDRLKSISTDYLSAVRGVGNNNSSGARQDSSVEMSAQAENLQKVVRV